MTATIDPATKAALQDFKQSLRNRYGAHLKVVLLFGSRARGEFSPDSDADVAVFHERENAVCATAVTRSFLSGN